MYCLGFSVELEATKNEHIETQQHTRLFYLLDGEVSAMLGEKNISLHCHDLLILNSGQDMYLRSHKDGTICCMNMAEYIFDDLLHCPNHLFFLDSSNRNEKEYKEIRILLDQFLLEHLQNGGSFDFSQLSLIFKLLHLITKYYMVDTKDTSKDTDTRISKILGYIHKNYDQPLSLSDLASELYISNVHLSRIFKQNIGINFRQYLNKIRLNHALSDLMHTDKTIIRIANDNGFSSVALFNKLFREEYHELPSAYRQQLPEHNSNQLTLSKHTKEDPADQLHRYQTIAHNLLQGRNTVFHADTSQTQAYTRPWTNMMNIGSASDVLNYKIHQHYTLLSQDLKFTYARFWGIFSEQIMLLSNNDSMNLNFNKLDEIISFLLKNHLKPFIQFGPKGRDLYGKDGSLLISEVNPQIITCSAAKWGKLTSMIIDHFIRVFEKEEVETWIFEMASPNPWDGTGQEWFSPEHFSTFYRAIKESLPGALVGGCEFAEEWYKPKFNKTFEYWKQAGTIPDFFSYLAVPYSLAAQSKKAFWLSNEDYHKELAIRSKAQLKKHGFDDRRIFFSFYNMTTSNRNILNDTVYKGAWIVKTAISSIDTVDEMCYWICSDVYAEYHDNQQFLFGGSGLIGINGHRKPAYYAFCFLKKLRSKLIRKNNYSVITSNSHGNYAIVYHNIKPLNIIANLKANHKLTYEDLDKLHDESEPTNLTFVLTNMPEGNYYIRIQRINRHTGSVLDNWHDIGGYNNIPEEDKVYLNQISIPSRRIDTKHTENSCLTIEVATEPDEFGLIEIFPSIEYIYPKSF